MEWIRGNIGTAVTALVLVAAVFFALRRIYRNKKEGKGGCSGSCSGCIMAGSCHTKKQEK